MCFLRLTNQKCIRTVLRSIIALHGKYTKIWDQYKSTIYILHLRFILVPVSCGTVSWTCFLRLTKQKCICTVLRSIIALHGKYTKFRDQYKSTIYIVHLRFTLVPVSECIGTNIRVKFTLHGKYTKFWDQYKSTIYILHLRRILVPVVV